MRALSVLIYTCFALMFGACAGSIPPSKLEPPAAVLLKPPAKIPDVKAGDDLVQEHLEIRRLYATETSRYRRLQQYVRTVRGE